MSSNAYDDVANPAVEPTVGDPTVDREGLAAATPGEDELTESLDENVDTDDLELDDDGMPDTGTLREAMKAVIDPEIGYNVVDLGLVYDVEKDRPGHVQVTMTLTSMGCPLTELIHQQVSVILGTLPGVEEVDVEFTFTPPWSPEMMSDDVRLELRAMGMNV